MSGENRTPGDHQLSSIQIPDELKEHYKVLTGVGDAEERGLNLKGLSRVNLFVGPNNSGKSRFLRGVAAAKELRFGPLLHVQKAKEVHDFLSEQHRQVQLKARGQIVLPPTGKLEMDVMTEGQDLGGRMRKEHRVWQGFQPGQLTIQDPHSSGALRQKYVEQMIEAGTAAANMVDNFFTKVSNQIAFHRLYLPTMRGLRPLLKSNQDVYADRINADYFTDGTKVETFTGLKIYDWEIGNSATRFETTRTSFLPTYLERRSR
jgi:hypothetical protein